MGARKRDLPGFVDSAKSGEKHAALCNGPLGLGSLQFASPSQLIKFYVVWMITLHTDNLTLTLC